MVKDSGKKPAGGASAAAPTKGGKGGAGAGQAGVKIGQDSSKAGKGK